MEQTASVEGPGGAALDSRPTRNDPAIVLSREGLWLVCWVEDVDRETRWVAAAADGVKHVGPAYAGEASLEHVGDAIRRWWTTRDRDRTWSHRDAAPRIQCTR